MTDLSGGDVVSSITNSNEISWTIVVMVGDGKKIKKEG